MSVTNLVGVKGRFEHACVWPLDAGLPRYSLWPGKQLAGCPSPDLLLSLARAERVLSSCWSLDEPSSRMGARLLAARWSRRVVEIEPCSVVRFAHRMGCGLAASV